MKRLWLESPVLLKIKRTGIALASPEIKSFISPFTSAPHQFPVHEIVPRHIPCFASPPSVVRQYLVAKIKTHHTADGAPSLENNHKFTILGEYLFEKQKVSFRKDRGAETVNAC